MCTYCGGWDESGPLGLCAECVRLHSRWGCESRPDSCDACAILERAGIVIDHEDRVLSLSPSELTALDVALGDLLEDMHSHNAVPSADLITVAERVRILAGGAA
jgi:hypothetical protein